MNATMRPIILIIGPTAGGKTALAVRLAETLPGGGECLSADSMQVYRGMDIGTAKPSAQEQARAPHHLIDLVDPSDDGFTVDTWLALANETIDAIRTRGRWPIVVGGTNLYIQAQLSGLFDGPEPDPVVRAALQAMTTVDLRAALVATDPESAERIHPNDRRRTIRAIEVYRQTGRPISALQREWDAGDPRADIRIIGLSYEVGMINRRINARVRQMLADGWLEEVRRLRAAGPLGTQARSAVGYEELLAHLDGSMTLDDAGERIRIRSRRLGKQQRTWLRRFRQLSQAVFLEGGVNDTQILVDKALEHILGATENAGADGPGGSNRPIRVDVRVDTPRAGD